MNNALFSVLAVVAGIVIGIVIMMVLGRAGLDKAKIETASILDEAKANVAKYIDDACLAKVPEVTIIHGKGQGILSKGLRAGFKKDKRIAEFAPGSLYEGGDGVTVIKFK